MADVRSGIAPGDTVVIVDTKGRLLRVGGRIVRGVVSSIAFGARFRTAFGDDIATVSLAHGGRLVSVNLCCLRRCPQLAYVRPRLQEGVR
jgi:hypothetical protein